MTLFLVLFIIINILLLIRKKSLLCNEIYWLIFFWILIIGVYCTAGVIWKYRVSYRTIIFLVICFSMLIVGRKKGLSKSVRLFVRETKNDKMILFTVIGIVGILLFLLDYFRLNGLFETAKSSYNISIIGSIGALLIPILWVEGLFIFVTNLTQKKRISIIAILLLVLYAIPCLVNSGRESVLYIMVSILSLYGFCRINTKKKSWRRVNIKTFFSKCLIAIVVFLLCIMIINISTTRFTQNEIDVFVYTHNITAASIKEAEKWGPFRFLYFNIASYFSHQLPFLEFLLQKYNGPYLFGMYELNIISRRLPSFLGLDYKLVYEQLEHLFFQYGQKSNFSGGWQTVFGSFLIDFTKFGAPIVCFLLGECIGRIRKKFTSQKDCRYAVLVALVCASMFATIQLGPFFNTLIYSAYIWWFIIFGRDEGR